MKKGDTEYLSNNMHDKSGINKDKIIILNNDNLDNSKLNFLNHSIIKQKPKIISDFSNYKKKGYSSNHNQNNTNRNTHNNNNNSGNGKKNEGEQNIIKNNDTLFKPKRMNTDINFNIKNSFNLKNKIKDSFKLKKLDGDNGNDIIKET